MGIRQAEYRTERNIKDKESALREECGKQRCSQVYGGEHRQTKGVEETAQTAAMETQRGSLNMTHGPKSSPFGAPDYIAATDSPHHTPLLERLEKCIGLGVAPCQFGSGTFF